MEFGVHPNFVTHGAAALHPAPWDYITRVTRLIEDLGYTYFAPGDHLPRSLDTLSTLTVAAGASTRLRLTTSILLLPSRGPLFCAQFLSALNCLSGGRVVGGVGSSSSARQLAAAGVDPAEMWPRFDEGVRALRALLDPELSAFKGKFYDTEGVVLEPPPAQKAHIPIWIGSWGSDAGLRRVARFGEGWIGSSGPGHQSPEQFAKDKQRLDVLLVKEGKEPSTFPTAISSMPLFVSENQEDLERHGASSTNMARARRAMPAFLNRPAERPEEGPHEHDMVGTRAECMDKVRRWKAAGVGALFLSPEGPDPEGQLRIFIEEVASKA